MDVANTSEISSIRYANSVASIIKALLATRLSRTVLLNGRT